MNQSILKSIAIEYFVRLLNKKTHLYVMNCFHKTINISPPKNVFHFSFSAG